MKDPKKPTPFIGVDEIMLLIGLVLLTAGLWSLVRAAALIAPGLVLLWMAVPPRHAFLARTPEAAAERKGRS